MSKKKLSGTKVPAKEVSLETLEKQLVVEKSRARFLKGSVVGKAQSGLVEELEKKIEEIKSKKGNGKKKNPDDKD